MFEKKPNNNEYHRTHDSQVSPYFLYKVVLIKYILLLFRFLQNMWQLKTVTPVNRTMFHVNINYISH